VGWPVAVPGAHPLVLSAARVVLDRAGGDGAVRDLAERVLAGRTATITPVEAHEHPTAPLEAP
jgi:N-acylneuraminate cytidylyltransferase